jgi:hypothetical protein
MIVIVAFGAILFAAGLFLARKYAAAGRARPVGTFMVTYQALLYYLGIVSAIVGALFLILAVGIALG